MTEITITEGNRMLAEMFEQYKWGQVNGKSYLYSLETGEPHQAFNPFFDERHALQVLEAWLKTNQSNTYIIHGGRSERIPFDHCEISLFGEYIEPCIPEELSHVIAPNLNHAICLAVLEAVTGVKYELVKE